MRGLPMSHDRLNWTLTGDPQQSGPAVGVHLVVDDYGAGQSNLARILDLNPKIVKLDGALIRGIDKDPRRQIMVRHMVALCIDLGAKVVAECIETVEELKAVADQGVH